MKRSGVRPTKAKIAHYWLKDDRLYHEQGIFLDWGEPSCWACGYWWNGEYDVDDSQVSFSDWGKLWQKTPLQRCHIVPESLGGSNEPSNFVLMCKECHDLSPDITDRALFFAWMRSQSYITRYSEKVKQALADFGVDLEDEVLVQKLALAPNNIDDAEFREWAKNNISLHGHQLPPYGPRLSVSTFVAAMLMYHRT